MCRLWKIWGRSATDGDFLDDVTSDPRQAAQSLELRISQYEVGELDRLLAVSSIPDALTDVGERVDALSTPSTHGEDFLEFLGALIIDPLLRAQVRNDGAQSVCEDQFLSLSGSEKQLIEDLLDDETASDAMDTVSEDGWFIACSLGLIDDPTYDHTQYTPQP
ncbi:MAG TPA: hypothetical protein VLV83_03805 [Acidobacteriota bacterium]|nr:hypothetical protein [Acidobacteriota bacterium]